MSCSAIFESDRLRTSAIAARCSSVIGCVETPASASFLRSRSMASSTADFGAESLDTSSAYPSLGFGGSLVEVREPCGRRPMRRAVL